MVSIVICCREFDILDIKYRTCFESILNQTYSDIETIVETEGSLLQARKRGIEKSKGEYICLVDADQVLPPELIESCVKSCELGWDGITWCEEAIKTETYCEIIINYDKQLFHWNYEDDPVKGSAIPRFFKAEYLKRIDWSKLPPITFEHSMIHKQIIDMGAKIGWVSETVLHHEPETFRELFKKFFRYGYYYFPALKFNKSLVINHSLPRRVYFTKQAFENPILYIGLWYHYLVKAVAATLGGIWYGISISCRNNSQL